MLAEDVCVPGEQGLAFILRFHGCSADPIHILHNAGKQNLLAADLVRSCRSYQFKGRCIDTNWENLEKFSLPALAECSENRWIVIGKISAENILVSDLKNKRARLLPRQQFEAVWTGRVALFTPRRSGLDMAKHFDISWFLEAIFKYRKIISEVLVASLFLQLFGLITPLFFQVVTDKVLTHRGYTTLDVMGIGILIVTVFESVLTVLRTYVFAHTTNRIDVELGSKLFRHLVALPISYFNARRVGDSIARVRELENIRQFITSSAITVALDLLFAFVFVAVMAVYSLRLTALVLASIPVYILISVLATPIVRMRLKQKFNRGAESQAFLVEGITAIETLKSLAIEPQIQNQWEEQLARYVRASFKALSASNFASQAVQFTSKIVTIAIIYFGALQVIDGDMSVGQLIAFNMLAGRVSQPVLRLAQFWQDFQQAQISVERLGDILNSPTERVVNTARPLIPEIRGDITMDNISFRYRPDQPETIKNIRLHIPAGQIVGVVGPSGSGKSTFARLIQRLYSPETGKVLIDGHDISLVDLASLRRQIGVVLQENVLLSRSIRENIAIANPSVSMARISAAAELAGAHEFIVALPEGYDTIVGERGSNLSGGQRQRIAIARALLNEPKILIFDEATSALDYESERIIQNNMKKIARGRTVIIIAHRLSTVRYATRIITLDRGEIVEDGNHDELIARNGKYAGLHKLQEWASV